jgi:hypothetical protein
MLLQNNPLSDLGGGGCRVGKWLTPKRETSGTHEHTRKSRITSFLACGAGGILPTQSRCKCAASKAESPLERFIHSA